jgi:outer membrane receptor for ferrienterochelin and colicin
MKTIYTNSGDLFPDHSLKSFSIKKLRPASLKGLLLLIGCLALQNLYPAIAKATDDEINQPVVTEEIVITATKTKKQISGVSATVEIINSMDIEAIGASNLKDIFEKTPDIQ